MDKEKILDEFDTALGKLIIRFISKYNLNARDLTGIAGVLAAKLAHLYTYLYVKKKVRKGKISYLDFANRTYSLMNDLAKLCLNRYREMLEKEL